MCAQPRRPLPVGNNNDVPGVGDLNLDKLFGHDVVFARRIELVGGTCEHLSKPRLETHQFFFDLRNLLGKNFFSLEDTDALGLSVEGSQFGGIQSSLVLESVI